ncbi:hypothetical protein HK097_008426, partial [Rhizophlyctis rosea]
EEGGQEEGEEKVIDVVGNGDGVGVEMTEQEVAECLDGVGAFEEVDEGDDEGEEGLEVEVEETVLEEEVGNDEGEEELEENKVPEEVSESLDVAEAFAEEGEEPMLKMFASSLSNFSQSICAM